MIALKWVIHCEYRDFCHLRQDKREKLQHCSCSVVVIVKNVS